MGYKLLIAGPRDWGEPKLIEYFDRKIAEYVAEYGMPDEVVSGACKSGVDMLGEKWAAKNGIPVKRFEADWEKYGKPAGPIRNTEMAIYSDRACIFTAPWAKGSNDMIKKFRKTRKPLLVCEWVISKLLNN